MLAALMKSDRFLENSPDTAPQNSRRTFPQTLVLDHDSLLSLQLISPKRIIFLCSGSGSWLDPDKGRIRFFFEGRIRICFFSRRSEPLPVLLLKVRIAVNSNRIRNPGWITNYFHSMILIRNPKADSTQFSSRILSNPIADVPAGATRSGA